VKKATFGIQKWSWSATRTEAIFFSGTKERGRELRAA
jgi:hypothetical protein